MHAELAHDPEIIHENTTTEHSTIEIHQLIDITTFSKLAKLLAVTAYVLRFTYNIRQLATLRRQGTLKPSELTLANLKWIHQIQHTVFSEEIANLQSNQSRLPLVRQLRLFLDRDKLLRCGGRIHNAPLSKLSKPDPPPLVKSQVSQSNPFAVTGVDFTGALHVRTTEGERKVYLCLFTCAVTRALHLEAVTNLTVECFL